MHSLLRRIRSLSVLALLVALGDSTAQTTPAADQPREFHLTSLGVQSRDMRYISPVTKRPFFLNVRPNLIAGPYALHGSTVPIFMLGPDGVRQPATIAHIPPGFTQPLVIILPGPVPGPNAPPLPYSSLVVDYSASENPTNSIHFLNPSPIQVGVAFGKNPPTTLPPGGQITYRFTPPPPNDCFMPLKIAFNREGAGWTRIPVSEPEDGIALDENIRIFVIIKPDPTKPDGGGASAFSIITTHLPPPTS
ncbi:MAG: hypothetical protein WC205_06920 [Opitutaceae bacterium]|jgi:hypothetical protein